MTQPQSIAGRLHQLLEYVLHLGEDPDIKTLVIPSDSISAAKIEGLPGIALNVGEDEEIWLQVQRLHPTKPPALPQDDYRHVIKITDNPSQQPTIDRAAVLDSIQIQEGQSEEALQFEREEKLARATVALDAYLPIWQQWSESEIKVRESIRIYDRLFSWRISLTATGQAPQEFVAGIGILGWKLPDTHHEYLYQLLTVPLEIVQEEDTLQIRPRDVPAQLEFNAFLAQDNLAQTGKLRSEVKATLLDGRRVTPFDQSTFSDIATAVIHNLHPHGKLLETDVVPAIDTFPTLSYRWEFFLRTRTSSVLKDDIAALQAQVLSAEELPEQPMSMVTPPSDEAASNRTALAFRGRGGIEGKAGGALRELYFPLPYNREQITIIDELTHSPGVAVQGPPGTGKTHTIANIICHCLAEGKRVLVTAEKAHVLNTVQEKIPAGVRPLVVSRVGSEQDGRRQLQSSIDSILQELTQMKPAIVEDDIAQAKKQIDHFHQQMILTDRRINEIAQVHYADIEIDGVIQRATALADLVINGNQIHQWFDDVLTLDAKHAPPLTEEEVQTLRNSRRKVGNRLRYLHARVPISSQLPTVEQLTDLHEVLIRINSLRASEQQGLLWPLQPAAQNNESILQALLSAVEINLDAVVAIEAEAQNIPWIQQLRGKLADAGCAAERAALENLIPESQELLRYRAELLARPIYLPEGLLTNPKFAAAVTRGAQTGKPFGMFSFGESDLKAAMSEVTVSGLTVSSAGDWEWVQKYLEQRKKIIAFLTRHNQFAQVLCIPDLAATNVDPSVTLRLIDDIYRAIQIAHRLASQFDGKLDSEARAVFTTRFNNGELNTSQRLGELHQHIDNHLTKIRMGEAFTHLSALREKVVGCTGEVTEQFSSLLNQLGTGISTQYLAPTYQQMIEEIKIIESLADDLELIRQSTQRIEHSGSVNFAHRIRTITVAGTGDDPVLPATWREAWTWARVRTFLDQISDRTELLQLGQTRKELEAHLAKCYEEVSTKQAWLSLKRNASAKVVSALARYKTAVQKIGKGTGKGADRHRKDAQDAMLDAADAIPCWVMTQFQVSETMPAKLGMFDLIIIDEASQSTIDALPVLMRGKKVLIVGDDKQVSPSNVGLSVDKIAVLRSKYLSGQPRATSFSPDLSLYDMASQIYPSQVMLLEHFRCHPAIISYSNKVYYDNKIRPLRISKMSERLDPPLVSIYTPEGTRSKVKSHNINRVEAAAIVAEIGALLIDPRYNGRSIGVISLLGAGQAELINTMALDELDVAELQRRDFACGEASSFQGAERDIIFLSMVATPEECHALSRTDHQQRFNVAASRARERMYLVHSVTTEHLSPVDLRNGLLQHFTDPNLREATKLENLLEQCDSYFERDVLTELYNHGYHVVPQVWAGGFRIDMVVEGEEDARLAIECDGDSFHGPDKWPADMARQRSLERAGWTFWRCFASTWKIARQETLQHLLDTLDKMGIKPVQGKPKATALCENREWRLPVDEQNDVSVQPQMVSTTDEDSQTVPV